MNERGRAVAVLDSLTQTYGKVTALDRVTITHTVGLHGRADRS